jgi:NTE family protein
MNFAKTVSTSLTFIFLLGACASKKIHEKSENTATPEQRETQKKATLPGPTLFPENIFENIAENAMPEKPKPTPPRQSDAVQLVLGPGWARTLAGAGVFKALSQQNIKLRAIFATEMSALVSALYLSAESENDFDWKLLRLAEVVFSNEKFSLKSLLGLGNREKKLEQFLDETFKDKTLSDLKTPLIIGISALKTNEFFILNKGTLKTVLRAAMGEPGIFKTVEQEGVEVQSCAMVNPFMIKEALEANDNTPVVAVDFTSPRSSDEDDYSKKAKQIVALSKQELSRADYVLKPDLALMGFLDFSKRATFVFRGKKSVETHITQIKKLVQEPESP